MKPVKNKVNPLKAWLTELFLDRFFTKDFSGTKGPSGKPLFTYQIKSHEFQSLCEVLKLHRKLAFHADYKKYWAACFCLYVAEFYRREYNATDGGWSWAPFEGRLECDFSPQQHAELVEQGLNYWKRPIRYRGRGRDLLGSLFCEGGLPWLLVKSKSHGFGRTVNHGLKNFHSNQAALRTTSDLVAEYESYLPQSFQTLETRQLLAGIVEQLIYLADHYPLKNEEDPAEYLDNHNPGWCSEFPIPLDEDNARKLINEWLKTAGKKSVQEGRVFICRHQLLGELSDWRILTQLTLAQNTTFKVNLSKLNSTRFELGFYEGDRLLAKGGAIYGQIVDEDSISVRFSSTLISLERRDICQPVSLQLLENGHQVHTIHFDHSALDYDDQPLIFEPIADQWWYAADASVSLASDKARFRLPSSFKFINGNSKELAIDKDGCSWFEINDDVRFGSGSNIYTIGLNKPIEATHKPNLVGIIAPYISKPSLVFLGWPQIEIPAEQNVSFGSLEHFIDGKPMSSVSESERIGLVRYRVKNIRNETFLQRKFGVLPKGFGLSLLPAINNNPASLVVNKYKGLRLKAVSQDLSVNIEDTDQSFVFSLKPKSEIIPTTFDVEVSGGNCEPLILRLPYPYQGARLIASNGLPVKKTELILDELIGMRIALSSGLNHGEKFFLRMKLIRNSEYLPKRQYVISVGEAPVIVNLYSYQNDIAQMLGAVGHQDAHIIFTIETTQTLLTLNIRRYNGSVSWIGNSLFSVNEINSTRIKEDAKVAAMLLSDPKHEPVFLNQNKSQGVETNCFSISQDMEGKGPWLIYPELDSGTLFRPVFWTSQKLNIESSENNINSLQAATQAFHPQKLPHVIDEQITKMAQDLNHSGWQFLSDLKNNFNHLPLSSFESWLALSRNPETLAIAVFKLEFDEAFCCRVHDELAVIWECIPLPVWAEVYVRFKNWLINSGLPDILVHNLLINRKAVLRMVVSGFDYVGEYLESGDFSKLTSIGPEHVLPLWYQDLRRRHASNPVWPNDLGGKLNEWLSKQSLPNSIKSLSLVSFTDAVTYLPIFMAFVTAGRAKLEDLPVDQVLLKFVINMTSDFDRTGWYTSVHVLLVSYLLAQNSTV